MHHKVKENLHQSSQNKFGHTQSVHDWTEEVFGVALRCHMYQTDYIPRNVE